MDDELLRLSDAQLAGELDLLCDEMEFAGPAGRVKGVGTIRSDELGRLLLRMVVRDVVARDTREVIASRPRGTIHPDEDYADLTARDHEGRVWSSPRLAIGPISPLWRMGRTVLQESLRTIRHVRPPLQKPGRVDTVLFHGAPALEFDQVTETVSSAAGSKLRTRSSRDHHESDFGPFRVRWHGHGGGRLTVESSTQHQQQAWPHLVARALSFATARNIEPSAWRVVGSPVNELTLYAGPFRSSIGLAYPPADVLVQRVPSHEWDLIESALLFSISDAVDSHELFAELEGVLRGAQGSLEVAALTLSVGIEAICGKLLPDVAAVDPKLLDSLFDHVGNWRESKTLRDRALGSLGNLKRTRAADRLYPWLKTRGLPNELAEAWKRLRDASAHGKRSEDTQQLLDRYHDALLLLYQLAAWRMSISVPLETQYRAR